MLTKSFSNLILTIVKLAILAQIAIVTYRPLSLNQKDLLESYSAITVDGFDFIITGRALMGGIISDWPVLRNPLFTSISALDSFFGNFGVAFSITIGISLLLQFISLNKLCNYFKLNEITSASIFLVFFMNNIHFIDVYILSDSISLSLMFFGITLIIVKKSNRSELLGSLLIVFSSLGQFYTLFGLLFLFMPNHIKIRDIFFRLKQKNSIITILAILISFIVRKIWSLQIGHESVPANFSLLKFNINMFNFYINTWVVIFIPFIISLLYFSFINPVAIVKSIKQYFFKSGLYISIIVGIFIFFYQWNESRFSYLLFIFVMINIIVFFGKELLSNHKNHLLILTAILTIFFNIIWAPKENWQPRVGESKFLRPWVTERYWERVPFAYYVEIRDKYCLSKDNSATIEQMNERFESDLMVLPSPIRDTARFGIANCL